MSLTLKWDGEGNDKGGKEGREREGMHKRQVLTEETLAALEWSC